jgi:hypothetical protein
LSQTVLAQREQFHQDRLVENIGSWNPFYYDTLNQIDAYFRTHTFTGSSVGTSVAYIGQMFQTQVDILAYIDVFYTLAFIAVIMIVLSLSLRSVEGLTLIRDVLCERRSVELAGRLRGAKTDRDARWFGTLFRKCLSVLALQFGFITSTRRPPATTAHLDGGIPNTADPAMNAAPTELCDPALHRGRPRANGHS